MTREEFIEVLDKKGYSYEIEGDKIVVTHYADIYLNSLKTLSLSVEFKNDGDVCLNSLKTLLPGVEFKNEGYVGLNSLKTLSPGVEFKNDGDVWLVGLKTLPPGVEFKNGEDVCLKSWIGREGWNNNGWFDDWEGNIKGIDSKRLLNLMISKGMFI